MKFRISANVQVECERIVEADSIEDAEEQAHSMDGDEWVSWAVRESIDVCGAEEVESPKRKPRAEGGRKK